MMNFSLLDHPIEIKGNTILVIEQVELYTNIIEQLYWYDDTCDLKLYNANNLQRLKSNEIITIIDPWGFNLNSRPFLKLVYQDIIDQLNFDPILKSNIESNLRKIESLIQGQMILSDLELTYEDIQLVDFLQAMNIKIDIHSQTIIDKIMSIIQMSKFLPKNQLLIFVNLLNYFNEKDIVSILEYVELQNMDVLFIEPLSIADLKHYVIDKDYYLFIKNDII